MLKLLLLFTAALLCSSCVSRTTYRGNDLTGSKNAIDKKEIVWFWQEGY